MKKIITILALALTVSACAANTPKLTLDQQLQDKSVEERKEVLRLACLNEAEWSSKKDMKKHRLHRHRFNQYLNTTEETRRLKALCREMSDNYSNTENK